MTNQRWNLANIKEGIELFIAENGQPPTARDFDTYLHLPSARQIQRNFGGMSELRRQLGYEDLDFTKGLLRKSIAEKASERGIAAEEYLEPILINHFGEPFVHTQKRYSKGTKNRYDFFIYAQDAALGVDVFTTTKPEYIGVNVRHKIHKYKLLKNVQTYFVLIGQEFTDDDIVKARSSVPMIKEFSNLHLVGEAEFLELIQSLLPLAIPDHFQGLE